MKRIIQLLFLLIFPGFTYAQHANVAAFKHTLRWLSESNFPNYFLDPQWRDSIYKDIKADLMLYLNVPDVSFPDRVEYKLITGFGKSKDELSKVKNSPGYIIDVYSFITRQTVGFAVDWSMKIAIWKDGNIVLQKEVTHEIENANAAVYVTQQRWWPPEEFRKIFRELTREAMGKDSTYSGKIEVGGIEEKEKRVRSWFPDSNPYFLKTRGAMVDGGNFSAQLVSDEDTINQFKLKNKWDESVQPFSLKPMMADLFSDLTNWETTYTLKEKERRRAVMEFSHGQKFLMQMDWIEEIITSTYYGEVEVRKVVPMVGLLYEDRTFAGKFIYEQLTELKATPLMYPFRPAIIHRISGKLHNKEFSAEYNEFLGSAEIKLNSESLAVMIFQNCNPENLNAFMSNKLSKNKGVVSSSVRKIGTPDLEDTSHQEWYPIFIRENATAEEQLYSIEFLVCLLFGVGIE